MPWYWRRDGEPGRRPFAPPAFRLMETFGDFILFKGTLGNVVAEGYFDRSWKVPPKPPPKC